MEEIIQALAPEQVERALHAVRFVRKTNNAGNEIYAFKASESPLLMQEVGRLREEAFREAGGGTGKAVDIDEYDTGANPCTQLVVWDPEHHMILSGYRFLLCSAPTEPERDMATAELFDFTEQFRREYLPYTIELGRSFVHPAYQSTKLGRKGIFALDNMWDGLGALVHAYPQMRYFFGKVTTYPRFNAEARNALLYFLHHYFPDPDRLLTPKEPLDYSEPLQDGRPLFTGNDQKGDFEVMVKYMAERNERMPPLVKSYMGLSPTMRMFGTGTNHSFGQVHESGILVTISDIYQSKITRHVETLGDQRAE